MECVQLIHIRFYDWRKRRFTSLAFRNSTNGGASVIDRACIDVSGNSVCVHIVTFYPDTVSGDPAIYWEFDTAILPNPHRLEQQTTPSGDVCHYNIHDLSDKQLKTEFRIVSVSEMSICDGGADRPLTYDDVEALKTP